MCIKQFSELAYDYYSKYTVLLDTICNFVSRVDYLSCISRVSLYNGYVKPIIDNSSSDSFIDAKSNDDAVVCDELFFLIIDELVLLLSITYLNHKL